MSGHNHDHDHGHHGHAHSAKPAEGGNMFERAWKDTTRRVREGVHLEAHGDHIHAQKIPTLGKVAIVAGSVASLGVALHGLDNMRRGALGYEDKQLGQKYDADMSRFLFGAAEFAGGLALAKRFATGHFKL